MGYGSDVGVSDGTVVGVDEGSAVGAGGRAAVVVVDSGSGVGEALQAVTAVITNTKTMSKVCALGRWILLRFMLTNCNQIPCEAGQ